MSRTAFEDVLSWLQLEGQLTGAEAALMGPLLGSEDIPPGKLILTEGSAHARLYFLVNGQIDVLQAGEKVAAIANAGDVLGELSVITGRPANASCVALTPVRVHFLETGRLGELGPKIEKTLRNGLNRLFARILAEKLNATNEKARLFEITARELEKAKKALETASRRRIDQLTWNQRALFKRLGQLVSSEIEPVREDIAKLGEQTPEPIREVANRIARLSRTLESLYQGFEAEKTLGDVRVLLAEDDIDEQINAKMSLGGTGVDLRVASSVELGREALQGGRFDVVCVSNNFVELIPFARARFPEAKVVFMTADPIAQHFHTLKAHPELSAILARHPDDRAFSVRNTATTVRKLTTRDIFGLDKYLAWGTEIHEERILASTQRPELIAKMSDYFKGMGIRGNLIRRCERVAEEMLMNAIYDAPVDREGKPVYNHLERNVVVTLKPEEQGTFRYACDGAFLAIAVEDPFGALDRSTILNYLERCFSEGVTDTLPESKGGGGNGIFQIIQSSSLVIFNVQPSTRTEVIALFNINIQINRISAHPSFHYFHIM